MSAGIQARDAERRAGAATCRVCQAELMGGAFCGECGAHVTPRRGDGPDWLRLRTFAAAPHEHVLIPSLAGALFGGGSARSLTSLRAGLTVMVVTLGVFAVLRIPGCLIAVVAVGLPLLFLLYLRQSGGRGDLAVSAALGGALGVVWALLTGTTVARTFDVPLGSGVAGLHVLTAGAGVSLATALTAFVPVVAIRLRRPVSRDSLDGCMFGAFGALCFSAGATVTRLYAQLRTGLVDQHRPLSGLLVEAGIRGLTTPVIAAAAGGLVGAALWFMRRGGKSARYPGSVRRVLVLLALALVAGYVGLGSADIVSISQWPRFLCHLAVALIAVVLLRLGLQLALMNEEHNEIRPERVAPCRYCGKAEPVMPFCLACGATARTRSAAVTVRRLVLAWAAGIAVVAATLVGVSALAAKHSVRYACPPTCGRPPMGKPVAVNPRFTAADAAFGVSYPAPSSVYSVTTDETGVTARYLTGDGGVLRLWGEPARGRSPRQIATELIANTYPDARTAYEIPNALVGYRPGYGLALDTWPDGINAEYSRNRVLVVVAVKDDLALIAGAVGPYHEFGPDFGSGPPTGASLEIAEDMGKYVNSFSWRGDPPR